MNTDFFDPQNLYKTYKIYKTYNGSTAPLTKGAVFPFNGTKKKKHDRANETGGLLKNGI